MILSPQDSAMTQANPVQCPAAQVHAVQPDDLLRDEVRMCADSCQAVRSPRILTTTTLSSQTCAPPHQDCVRRRGGAQSTPGPARGSPGRSPRSRASGLSARTFHATAPRSHPSTSLRPFAPHLLLTSCSRSAASAASSRSSWPRGPGAGCRPRAPRTRACCVARSP